MRLAGAIDIGGTTIKIGIVAADGAIVARGEIPTPSDGDPIPLVDGALAALTPMIDATKGQTIPRVGVSVAGFLDGEHDSMIHNANLPALSGFPLRRRLTEKLGVDCLLEVDSNAAVVAEYRHGAGRGADRLLGVTVGTGLGGGVVIGGDLLRFTGECAGDLGHIIIAPNGRRCTCGSHGCLEAMVCAEALSERVGDRPARDVIDSARQGDRVAVDALAQTGLWLGLGLAALSSVFAPESIVVGGGIGTAGELLLAPTRASYRANASTGLADRVQILGSSFGGWAGMIGAGSLALDPLP